MIGRGENTSMAFHVINFMCQLKVAVNGPFLCRNVPKDINFMESKLFKTKIIGK